MMALTVMALVILFVAREINSHIHDTRRDQLIDTLTSKLMAKDFTEYQEAITPLPTYEPVMKDDEDLYLQELEEAKR